MWTFIALGRVTMGQNRWQEAERWHQDCLVTSEERFGREHPNTAGSLNNLAELYRVMGRYEAALPLSGRSLAIRERALGASHPDTANSLNNLAVLYRVMERYGEAEGMYVRSLAILGETLGVT